MFDCIDCPINFEALELLVSRSPSLKKLRVNRNVNIGQLYRLMIQAPQLTHLGTGSFSPSEIVAHGDPEPNYVSAFTACRSLVCLSGFREIIPDYLPAIYPVCASLTSLNFSYANIDAEQLRSVICLCHKLQILWVCNWVAYRFKLTYSLHLSTLFFSICSILDILKICFRSILSCFRLF